MKIDSGRLRTWGRTTAQSTTDRQAPSLRRTLGRNLTVLAVSCAMFALGYAAMSLYSSAGDPVREQSAKVAETADRASQVKRLVQHFDCWDGAAPADMAGQVPGHVIVTRTGDLEPIRGGDTLVGKALEQIFDEVDHGLQIHAFCR